MRAWDPESRILAIDRGRARESTGMRCQPIAGYEREMFSAGCTMNIGSKKLLREVASTFCGAQAPFYNAVSTVWISTVWIRELLSGNSKRLGSRFSFGNLS